MTRMATLVLHKEDMKFSAGHFTIFSATERENMHGHNFRVQARITMPVNDNGITVNYNDLKSELRALCRSLNNVFLIPTCSPHLRVLEEDRYWRVYFHDEVMTFLKRDVLCLPLRNITVEELSHWFIEQMTADQALAAQRQIKHLEVQVSTDVGQWGCAST